MSTKAQKIARLKNKKYRDAFVASQISVGLPFQIRALREQRGWKQSQLAGKAEMLQPRISAMERPGGAKFTIETLRRLASAFDVALVVRFVPFRDLVDWSERFNPDTFVIPSFDEDMANEKGNKTVPKFGMSSSGYVVQGDAVSGDGMLKASTFINGQMSFVSGLSGEGSAIDTMAEMNGLTIAGLRLPPRSIRTVENSAVANG